MGEISLKDPFGSSIVSVIQKYELRHNLEIGSWDGIGSTQCFIRGMLHLRAPKKLYCLEILEDRYKVLVKNVEMFNFVEPLNMSSITSSDLLVKDFDTDFWTSPYRKEKYPFISKEDFYSWYQHDISVMKDRKGFLEEYKDSFDAVLIDGSLFTGYSEFALLKDRTKCFFLDDVHKSFKCNRIYQELNSNTDWTLLYNFPDVRYGACVFIRLGL